MPKFRGGGTGEINRIAADGFGDDWLTNVSRALVSVNRAAKQSVHRDITRALYNLKGRILNQLIADVDDRSVVEIHYQQSGNECFLLITLIRLIEFGNGCNCFSYLQLGLLASQEP